MIIQKIRMKNKIWMNSSLPSIGTTYICSHEYRQNWCELRCKPLVHKSVTKVQKCGLLLKHNASCLQKVISSKTKNENNSNWACTLKQASSMSTISTQDTSSCKLLSVHIYFK
jgi:hypothetical protein